MALLRRGRYGDGPTGELTKLTKRVYSPEHELSDLSERRWLELAQILVTPPYAAPIRHSKHDRTFVVTVQVSRSANDSFSAEVISAPP